MTCLVLSVDTKVLVQRMAFVLLVFLVVVAVVDVEQRSGSSSPADSETNMTRKRSCLHEDTTGRKPPKVLI